VPASQATGTVPLPLTGSAHAISGTAVAWGVHVQPEGHVALVEHAIVCATQLEVERVVVVQTGGDTMPASTAEGGGDVTGTPGALPIVALPAELEPVLLEPLPPELPPLATPPVPELPEQTVTVSGVQLNPGPQSEST